MYYWLKPTIDMKNWSVTWKEAFKRGLLDMLITLHSKTSALVDDYRF
jgi:hypothetical protein